jgi:uncharacterized protein
MRLAAPLLPFLLLLAVAVHPAAAQQDSSGPVRVTALAVEETSEGLSGSAATVEATVLAGGRGRVYVATKPLALTDMQGSARLAAQVAASTLGLDWTRYDYLVGFTSGSTVIGGPSAGADMALAILVALHNLGPGEAWQVDPAVAATGTINPDGTIGPVGGVPAKAEAAAQAGIRLFLYPAGLEQAPDYVPGPGGLRLVQVDMSSHCSGLGIECRPVSTLVEVVAAAAHRQLQVPDVPVPGTTDYAALLEPEVRASVEGLAGRVESASAAAASVPARQAAQVRAAIEAARARLDAARGELEADRFYAAATEAFQGAIAAARAENLTRFYAQGRSEAVVASALATCREQAEAAVAATRDLRPASLNALYSVGAAQVRALEAERLVAQAEARHERATTFDDWVASLESSAFCAERAKTAIWWASLRETFVPGPALEDLEGLARDAVDQAADLVGYANAVLESQGGAADATQALQEARAHLEAGRPAAAIIAAVDAGAFASVAMQAGAGGEVPEAVLDAARQGAARAIDRARAQGAEPMLSVSLVELAQGRTGTQALHGYWTARSLALLQAQPPPPPAAATLPGTPATGYPDTILLLFLAVGFVVGLGAAGIVAVLAVRPRRP